MFVVMPLLSFYFIFLIFYKRLNRLDGLPCWRSAFLSASVVWAVILIAITECLSVLSLITFNWVLFSWGLVCIASALIYHMLGRRQKSIVRFQLSKIPRSEALLLFSIAYIVIMVGLIALIAPPNNWDSMTYHMSRVAHWIQNRTLVHYPTHILRQLTVTPGAEFVIMNFQILSGGDRFANLVQWFCMLGSIIGVSLIAKQLGADIRGQVFSAVVCATIPMGILQGSSTQNDYVVSFWMVCFVYYTLLMLKERMNLSLLLKIGASLGLAILTKGTAYIYTFPFLVWFVFSGFKKFRWNLWKPLLIILIVAIFMNVGYYTRNFNLYGRPHAKLYYLTNGVTLPLFISSIVRNMGLHLGTPSKLVNHVMYRIIRLIHKILGVVTNDPRTTVCSDFSINFSLHEDSTGNFLHLILIIVSVVIFFIARQKRKQRDLIYYLAALTSAFLLLCFVVKWQPWASRFHLPVFVLFSPFIAIVLSRTMSHKITNFIGVFLILTSFPWVFSNDSRPFIKNFRASKSENVFNTSRIEQYFRNWPGLKDPYMGAVQFIKSKGCLDIGIILDEDDWEYPFFVLLQKNTTHMFRIEHVDVNNISSVKYGVYPFNDFNPSAIISLKYGQKDTIVNKDTVYVKEWSSAPVARPGSVVQPEPVSVFIKR